MRERIGRHPYVFLGLLSASVLAVFSFLVFPKLVGPLHVDYMRADGYYDIAENLLAGKGFYVGDYPRFQKGAFKREPFYPFFLALNMKLPFFPVSLVVIQLLLYVLTVFLVYRLFLDFGRGREAALWTAALFAVYPYSYWYAAKPTPENLTPLFLVAHLWLTQRYLKSRGAGDLVLWAASCALCTLAKSNLVLLLPIGLALFWLTQPRTLRLWRHLGLAAALFALGLSPWVIRNYRLSHRIIWGSTMGGTSFFVGNMNANWATLRDLATHLKGEEQMAVDWKKVYLEKTQNGAVVPPDRYVLEAEIDGSFDKQVRPWVLSHKVRFAKKVLFNLATMWFITSDRIKSLLLLAFQTPLLICFFLGVWRLLKSGLSPFERHMLAVFGFIYCAIAAILGDARYVHVFLPILFYFAWPGLRFALRRDGPPAPALT